MTSPQSQRLLRRQTAYVLAGWAGLIALAHIVGRPITRSTLLFVPPLFARWGTRLSLLTALPVAVAGLVVWRGPDLARRLPWRRLLLVSWAAAAVWAIALAVSAGWDALSHPLLHRTEYIRDVGNVGNLGEFLSTFTERLASYRVHVQGHPPGFLVLLWAMDRIGLGGPLAPALLVVVAGGTAAPAVMIALRAVADEDRARDAAPFLVLLPAAIWVATSADALFMAMAAWGFCLFLVAATRTGGRGDVPALASGLLFGIGLHMTYGLAPMGLSVIAVAATLRRIRPLVAGGLGVAAVTAVFTAAGFWWYEGLQATIERYVAGAGGFRPGAYHWWANLAAFAIALGPATAVAISRLRDLRVWLPVAAVLLAVASATASGMSKGEVERIWLPFVPWVAAGTCALAPDPRTARLWLAAQALVALLVQTFIRTAW